MIRVEVSEQDISEGCAAACDNCPVARALARTLRSDAVFVVEHCDGIYLEVDGWLLRTGEKVTRFVRAFDKWPRFGLPGKLPKELAPFSFLIPELNSNEWQEEST